MNYTHDKYVHPDLVEHRTCIDELEPIPDAHSDLRDAALRSVQILTAFANVIERSLARPGVTVQDVAVQFWGAAMALGLPCCDGLSYTDRSALLRCERATLSKCSTAFVTANDLAPSWFMKNASTGATYSKARLDSIAANNAELPPVPPRDRSV